MSDPSPGLSAPQATDRWRARHGPLLLIGVLPLLAMPEQRSLWPFPLLIPLLFYGVVVLSVGALRRTADWAATGTPTTRSVLCASLVAAGTVAALLGFERVVRPDLGHLDAYLPGDLLESGLLSAAVFVLLNPVLEEVVFRGVLWQSLAVRHGWIFAAIVTSVLFGLGHLHGYPPGAIGGVLAGVFALAVSGLRQATGGLLLPVLVHVVADATILAIRHAR